jgi:hypothetical protein
MHDQFTLPVALLITVLTMLKITVDLIGSNIRCHSDNRDSRTVLPDVHGGRDTIQLRHDDVHKDHVEMITRNARNAAVCIRSILLF